MAFYTGSKVPDSKTVSEEEMISDFHESLSAIGVMSHDERLARYEANIEQHIPLDQVW